LKDSSPDLSLAAHLEEQLRLIVDDSSDEGEPASPLSPAQRFKVERERKGL